MIGKYDSNGKKNWFKEQKNNFARITLFDKFLSHPCTTKLWRWLGVSLENSHVDIGAQRVNKAGINLGFWETAHLPLP